MNNLGTKLTTRDVALLGLLIAMDIIVGKFLSFGVWSVRISLTFIIVFFMAAWFGPIVGGVASAIADIVGTLLMGGIGGYFVGFTISAFIEAFIYGVIFYDKKVSFLRILCAVLINILVVDALLNTFWIMWLYHALFWSIFPVRILKELLMIPIQVILLSIVSKNTVLNTLKNHVRLR
ncbi:folate family ECF transporter S component [Liquorilactobacillus uvarum]|uniref:Uncharacterized protein n=1 Tax=Liquorilactobacillus uvarum DSM 19971 TaxID=1423812 RepID=A0A0R1Q2L7_9LACO|nr:folate family ECF transporter S component [Liquorilactobacillus uvarum]KRL38903.1 hypothetical protein FD20_GL000978 [Liquorilactobacillus uvarum DSM 19971]